MSEPRFTVKYVAYRDTRPHKRVKTETFDTKPSKKYLVAEAKKLDADWAHVYDTELPEIMFYYMLDSGSMFVCPVDNPGSSICNEPLKWFHLIRKIPPSYAEYVVRSHEITVGHLLNRKHKAPLHNDGRPQKRKCLSCGTAFDAKGNYGKVCCSNECYAAAANDGIKWDEDYVEVMLIRPEHLAPTERTKAAKPAKAPKVKPEEKICQNCGKSFVPKAHKWSAVEINACSHECLFPIIPLAEKGCPKCHKDGVIETAFGWRKNKKGKAIPQSQCKKCRSGSKKVDAVSIYGGN